MNLQSKLEQFRSDNPYDIDTQAKRLLASNDKELILYTLALGLQTAKQRQRHFDRDYIKNVGAAPPKEKFIPGPVTGSVKVVKIKPSKRMQNAMQALILDVWMVGDKCLGDCNHHDLTDAINRQTASRDGLDKNITFYTEVKKPLNKNGSVNARQKWDQTTIRPEIKKVYGEFRTQEAGGEEAA